MQYVYKEKHGLPPRWKRNWLGLFLAHKSNGKRLPVQAIKAYLGEQK
jgi:hypothetical protein